MMMPPDHQCISTLPRAQFLGRSTKYKYQPFLEKRHEQLKSVFGVAPVWVKSPRRVASLLWLYFVVELVQALVEREMRRQMARWGVLLRCRDFCGHSDCLNEQQFFNLGVSYED